MHRGVIDFQKNELLNHAGEPKNGHAYHEKTAERCGSQFCRKKKTYEGYENKQVNQPEISDLDNGFVGDIQFSQFIFPVK